MVRQGFEPQCNYGNHFSETTSVFYSEMSNFADMAGNVYRSKRILNIVDSDVDNGNAHETDFMQRSRLNLGSGNEANFKRQVHAALNVVQAGG